MRFVQLVGFTVQSQQLFRGPSETNDNRQRKPAQIVSVNRLSGLQHHVIRYINNVVDRSESGSFKPATHPIRTGTNGDASDLVKDRKWASLRGLNTNLRRIRNRFGRTSAGSRCFWTRELKDDPQFARNADVAQQIRTIGRD